MPEETYISIPLSDYVSLIDDANTLGALEAFGVDNWAGYDEAMASLDDDEDAEDEEA